MSPHWTEVAKASDVPEAGTLQVTLAGEPVCLYKIDGVIYATHDTCTHGQASLSEGFIIEDHLIECPLHQGSFDVRTGEAVAFPCTVAIRSYPVRTEGDAVLVAQS